MKHITTVAGAIPPEELGYCQCHEHLLLRDGQPARVNPALVFDDPEASAREAEHYIAAGGRSVVDAQPIGCGRMPDGLAEISKRTGINIVACTGFHKMIFYPEYHWVFSASENDLCRIFTEEITGGMYVNCDRVLSKENCPSRAGLIKAALDTEGLTPQYMKLFRAAVHASLQTDTSVMIHIEQGADVLELFQFLTGLGLSPERMIFCHLDRACGDLDVHKKLCEKGAFLDYDTIGRFKYHSDEHELSIMKEMLDSGYEDRLLFSLDTTRNRLKAYGGDIGLDYILKVFLPMMKANGITELQVQKIFYENSRNVLATVS